MNIEMFFVKTDNRNAVIGYIKNRLCVQPDLPGNQSEWGLESSYDILLANEPKRKVAISPVENGWIAGIESKEVLDFAMLQEISERLSCEIVVCQLANIADSCGYARCNCGQLVENSWSENDPDPLGTLRVYLRKQSIFFDLLTFREAVRLRDVGWEILP